MRGAKRVRCFRCGKGYSMPTMGWRWDDGLFHSGACCKSCARPLAESADASGLAYIFDLRRYADGLGETGAAAVVRTYALWLEHQRAEDMKPDGKPDDPKQSLAWSDFTGSPISQAFQGWRREHGSQGLTPRRPKRARRNRRPRRLAPKL